ncbi:MAG: hypothetical protein N3F04_05395 [Candidatus Nezhaarchaeota archaeon]|nr:hypothetical protein [Candidatus Nezhaarchaeota archaeon]MCX8142176.1 hypothetical protein [Candidatus Nezhaarchaeota archaeon]MDW8050041.1 hypothetical protein [Nitrososphaerota archaeon]
MIAVETDASASEILNMCNDGTLRGTIVIKGLRNIDRAHTT